MKDEITIEITDYCPHNCKFCSSDATSDREKATFLNKDTIKYFFDNQQNTFEHIIISGGEPLAHPQFWDILMICKKYSDDVVIYSNAITHLVYNPHVIDGVYLEANITVTPETDKIHILRRVKQGKEKNRPEIHLSRNHSEECSCEHRILRPDGKMYKTPCNKHENVKG